MLELKNVTYKTVQNGQEKVILDDVSCIINDGEFIAVTGHNGSGKSTLTKAIMGMIKISSGTILYNGKDITNLPINERAKLGIGFAFQQPVKFKGITVFDLLKLSSGKEINKKEACDILSKVGLCAKEYVDREVNSSLSGGELKRIEIASVAVRSSKFTIIDEPEAGIDLWSFQSLTKIFEDMRKIVKGTTLIISHQERIIDIADEIILMKAGKIEKIGKKEDLLGQVLDKPLCCKLGGEQ